VDDKLQEIEHKFDRLTANFGDPTVLADQARFKAVSKEHAQLKPLVETYRDFKRVRAELRENQALKFLRNLHKFEVPQRRKRGLPPPVLFGD